MVVFEGVRSISVLLFGCTQRRSTKKQTDTHSTKWNGTEPS
jgi:hypothetical protein